MPRRQAIFLSGRESAFPFLSPAVRAGDFIYVSGHSGLKPGSSPSGSGSSWVPGEVVAGGIEAETRQTLESIRELLRAAGADLRDVVRVNAYLADIDRDFAAYTAVYQEFFPSDPPARTTVGATIIGRQLVEIDCVAYVPGRLSAAQPFGSGLNSD